MHPGVAKFGIALEWGSRGLEFESRHSDQNQNSKCCSGFLFYRNHALSAKKSINRFNFLHLHFFPIHL